MSDIGIRLSLDGAGQVQGGLSAVGDSLQELDSRVLKVGDALRGFGAALLGTLSVGALGDFIKSAIESAAGLQQLSEQTGVSVESLGALRSVARLSGTSMDDMRTALQRLSRSMVEAESGTGEAAETFRRLGITVTDGSGKLKTADQVFLELAQATQRFEAGAELTTAQVILLGRAGANLGPVLADLAERGDLNGKVTAEQARQADEFEKAMVRLKSSFTGAVNSIVLDMLPALEKLGGLVKIGVEVGVAYAALFYGLPALYGAATIAADAFAASVAAASLATTTMSGALGVAVGQTMAAVSAFGLLKSAGLAVVAAFAGWEIGTWLRENFLEAQLAGIAFVEGTLVGWERIKFAGSAMWLALQDIFYTMVAEVGSGLADMLDGIARGLTAIGFNDLADGAKHFSDSIRTATRSGFDFEAELAKLQKQTDDNIAGVRAITGDMADQAVAHFKVADSAKQHKETLEAAGVATKAAASEFEKAAEAGAKLAASLLAQESGLSGDFFDKWDKLRAALALGKISSDDFFAAQAQLLAQQPYMKAALKEQEAATKALEEAKKSYLQAFEMVREAELAEVEDLQKLVAKQREHNETLGLTAEQLRQVESTRLREALAIAEQNLQLKLSEGLQGADLERYTLKVEALRELIRLREDGAAKEAVLEEARTARDAWAETVKSIQEGLTDALYRAFESGQGFLQAFKNLLVNTFKTTILKPIIQAVLAPVTGAIGGLMGAGNAVAGTGSMLSGAGGLMGNVGSIVSGFGAFGGAMTSGFSLAVNGGMMDALAGGVAMVSEAAGLSSAMAGIGQIAGALGPIALGIGAIAALAGALGGGGTPHVGAAFTASTDGRPSTMLTPGNAGGWQIGSTWSAAGKTNEAIQGTVRVFTESLAATMGTALRTYGLQPGSVRAGFTADNDDPSAGRITIRDATGRVLADMTKRYAASASRGFEQFAADAGKVLRDALVAADLPAEVDQMLTDLGDTPSLEAVQLKIQRLSEIKLYTDAVGQLGGIFTKIAGSSLEARDSLIELAGGIGSLMERSRSFVQNYYSQDEQASIQAQSLQTALTALGLGDVSLSSREEFRALVESRDVNTEQGRQQLVGLLNLADAFAGLSQYLEDAGTNVAELAQTSPYVQLVAQVANAERNPAAAALGDQQQAVVEEERHTEVITSIDAAAEDARVATAELISAQKEMLNLWRGMDNGGSLFVTVTT